MGTWKQLKTVKVAQTAQIPVTQQHTYTLKLNPSQCGICVTKDWMMSLIAQICLPSETEVMSKLVTDKLT